MNRLLRLTKYGIPFLWLPLLAGCEGDDYVYPSVRTELVDLQTDATGTARWLNCDEGHRWNIQARMGLDGLAPDTVYRTVSLYEPHSEADSTATLYSTQLVVSPLPVPEALLTEQHEDPVELQSIWRSGRYLNLVLQVRVKDQPHVYRFVEHGLTEKNGRRTLHLGLYHDRQGDAEAFRQKIYASVPLWPYADLLEAGDSVTFHFTTYREGKTHRSFAFGTVR